jgi:hypothetical protein
MFELAQAFRNRTAHISDIQRIFDPRHKLRSHYLDAAKLKKLSAITLNHSSNLSSRFKRKSVKHLLLVLCNIVNLPDDKPCYSNNSMGLGQRWLDAMGFQSSISPVTTGRLLFQMENGAVGLGPDCVQACDTVWLLRGAPAPMVLRPTPGAGYFQVVGEAYISGLMNGEISKKLINQIQASNPD